MRSGCRGRDGFFVAKKVVLRGNSWFRALRMRILGREEASTLVPQMTGSEMYRRLSDALDSPPLQSSAWVCTRWAAMPPGEQLRWVERRRAALYIVWVRGGGAGFSGLGRRLSEALADID